MAQHGESDTTRALLAEGAMEELEPVKRSKLIDVGFNISTKTGKCNNAVCT